MYIILGEILKNLQAEAVRLRTISTELTQEVKEKMRMNKNIVIDSVENNYEEVLNFGNHS